MKDICKEGNHFRTFPESQKNSEDFPGSIVFKTLGFQCKVSDRWLGNYDAICHVVQSEDQNNNNNNNNNNSGYFIFKMKIKG